MCYKVFIGNAPVRDWPTLDNAIGHMHRIIKILLEEGFSNTVTIQNDKGLVMVSTVVKHIMDEDNL